MSYLELVKAEYKLVYGELLRRKSAFISLIMYPYLFTGFTLFLGYAIGSPQSFSEKIGVDPLIYLITASYLMFSILVAIGDILWRPLNDLWVGTLPYIIASPVNRVKLYFAIPLPRLTGVIIMGSTSIAPVYLWFYGLSGLIVSFIVIGLSILGGLLMITFAITTAGLIHSMSESWRVLNIVRPILMILLGIYYPRFLMPLSGYILSSIIPSSHVVEAVQRILMGGYNNLHVLLVIAIVLALLYTPLGKNSFFIGRKRRRKKVLKQVRRAYAVLKAYALAELVRSKGLVYGLIGFSILDDLVPITNVVIR